MLKKNFFEKDENYFTDLAVEAAEAGGLKDISTSMNLSHGIVRRKLEIASDELAKKLGRECGRYITFDCPSEIYDKEENIKSLAGYMTEAIKELLQPFNRQKLVLVVGLGNGGVAADALGARVVSGISITKKGSSHRCKLNAITTGVFGTTGIESAELAAAVADRLEPTSIIVIDSLATSAVFRLGTSFQLTTAGIAPAGGVGIQRMRLDKRTLGVPVLAIGVPLMLTMRTAIYGFMRRYFERAESELDEPALREELKESSFSGLVVAPKEIDYLVDAAGAVISAAINGAFANSKN